MYYLKIRKAESHCFRLWGANSHVSLSSSRWHQRRQQTLTAHGSRPAIPVSTSRPWTVHAIFFQICRLGWVPLQGSPYSTKTFSLLASLELHSWGTAERQSYPSLRKDPRARGSNKPLQPACPCAGKYGEVSGQQTVYVGTGKYVVTVAEDMAGSSVIPSSIEW